MKEKIIYKGVEIVYACGYYYPAVNGNVECKTVEGVKRWIDEVWLFCVETQKDIDRYIDQLYKQSNL